ncbi:MAG: PKD domain-containing protein [Bacteroidota bacterium]|nr:PKD domain-containing protein [Bacteroidota bacterium]
MKNSNTYTQAPHSFTKSIKLSTSQYVEKLTSIESIEISESKGTSSASLPYSYVVVLFILISMSLCLGLAAQPPMVRLQMSGVNNSLDETILYYQAGATDGFDNDFDAYKLSGPNPHPLIALTNNSTQFQINGVEPVIDYLSMPVLATTPTTGTFTIFATDYENIPSDASVQLIDLYTGASVDIRTSDYTFVLDDSTSFPRFSLDISAPTINIVLNVFQPNCSGSAGKCVAEAMGAGPWTYTWKDSTGTVLRNSTNITGADSLTVLSAGIFSVVVTDGNGTEYGPESFTINSSTIQMSVTSFQPGCAYNEGKCVAEGLGFGPWNYIWKDSLGNILRNMTNVYGADSLTVLSAGIFSVEITNEEGCGFEYFTINAPGITPTASFTSADSILLVNGGTFFATNTSINAIDYVWNYGDDGSFSYGATPNHVFIDEGNYSVTLIAINTASGCFDSTSKVITVYKNQSEVGIEELTSESVKWCTLGNNQYMALNEGNEQFDINMYDINGKAILSEISSNGVIHFDFNHLGKGVYLINFATKKSSKRIKCFVE